jgi:hypothetical protein
MPRKRETYSQRIERGLARGLSRSQARGHARSGEAAVRSPRSTGALDDKLIAALRAFRSNNNVSAAAREAHVSRERFRTFLDAEKVASRQGRRWTITDNLVRELDMISQGRRQVVHVRSFDAASTIEKHNAAVRAFVSRKRDIDVLAPFDGVVITDTAGRKHPLETRPNKLLRLASSGGDGFEAVYRIII